MDGILGLIIFIAIIAGFWKVFTKAGHPGWAALIPIYNLYILITIAGKPWWWLLLFLVPILNIIICFVVTLAVARKFGQGVPFACGLFFLSFIFYPILGFGDFRYNG